MLRNFDRVFDVSLSEIFFRVVDVTVQLIFQKLIRFSRANDVDATVEVRRHLSHRGQLLFGVLMKVQGDDDVIVAGVFDSFFLGNDKWR